MAQYRRRQPFARENCRWLQADFSDLDGIRDFLERNKTLLRDCGYLVNNYGPITYKDTQKLTAEDFVHDYHHNVIVAMEISRFLLIHARLESVVNIGFEFAGYFKAFKKILTYAAAKNSLLLFTKSMAALDNGVRFNMVSPVTIEGANLPAPNRRRVSPETAAQKAYEVLTGQLNGENVFV